MCRHWDDCECGSGQRQMHQRNEDCARCATFGCVAVPPTPDHLCSAPFSAAVETRAFSREKLLRPRRPILYAGMPRKRIECFPALVYPGPARAGCWCYKRSRLEEDIAAHRDGLCLKSRLADGP